MKVTVCLIALLMVAACGGGGGSGGGPDEGKALPLSSSLSREEKELVNTLLEKQTLSEKEIMWHLLKVSQLSAETLSKLDRHIQLTCFKGVCELTRKEIK